MREDVTEKSSCSRGGRMPDSTTCEIFFVERDRFCKAFKAESLDSSFPVLNMKTRGSIAPSSPSKARVLSVNTILESAVAIRILLISEPVRSDVNCEWSSKLQGENKGTGHIVMVLFLKDIVPAASNNIDTRFILLEKGKMTADGQSKTCMTLVADETAAVHFQLWGAECDAFQTGDIIMLSKGIFSYQRNNLLLRAGKRGKIEKIGEFALPYVETPNMSEISWGPDPCNPVKYVQGNIISPHSRIFPPVR